MDEVKTGICYLVKKYYHNNKLYIVSLLQKMSQNLVKTILKEGGGGEEDGITKEDDQETVNIGINCQPFKFVNLPRQRHVQTNNSYGLAIHFKTQDLKSTKRRIAILYICPRNVFFNLLFFLRIWSFV